MEKKTTIFARIFNSPVCKVDPYPKDFDRTFNNSYERHICCKCWYDQSLQEPQILEALDSFKLLDTNGRSHLIDLVQSLPMLQSLVFGFTGISENADMNYSLVNKLNVVKTPRLKSLSIGPFKPHGSKGIMEPSNLLFHFILKSCPFIEEFELSGHIYAGGALDLDFSKHDRLNYIMVMKGCRYYTFHGDLGKLWENVGKLILEENINKEEAENLPFCINLDWMDNNRVKLQLADCKVAVNTD